MFFLLTTNYIVFFFNYYLINYLKLHNGAYVPSYIICIAQTKKEKNMHKTPKILCNVSYKLLKRRLNKNSI